jgi:hypothetical protein
VAFSGSTLPRETLRFGRHVVRRPHDGARLREGAVSIGVAGDEGRYTKVENLQLLFIRRAHHEEILGL